MHVIVAGGGVIGEQVARALQASGNTVVVVEADAERAAALGARGVQVVAASACWPRTLEEAGALRADVLVACTGHDEENLVISVLARRHFEIPRVVATVREDANRWLFDESWGVDAAISSASALVALVEEAAGSVRTVRLPGLADAGLVLVEVNVAAGSLADGVTVRELVLPAGDLVAAVIRHGGAMPAEEALRLAAGDRLLVLTGPDGEAALYRAFYPDAGDRSG
jgi:trk system potassium uptake protein TrkA